MNAPSASPAEKQIIINQRPAGNDPENRAEILIGPHSSPDLTGNIGGPIICVSIRTAVLYSIFEGWNI
jgi:hypothetical protein